MIEPNHLPDPNGYEIPNSKIKVFHINGCLFKLEPMAGFTRELNSILKVTRWYKTIFFIVEPNGNLPADVKGAAWTISRTDFMPRWYVTGTGLLPMNIVSTDDEDLGENFVGSFDIYQKWKRYSYDFYDPWNVTDRWQKW